MIIEDQKIKMFAGNYTEYLKRSNKPMDHHKEEVEKKMVILKNSLSEVIGRLSMPSKRDDVEALNREYYAILEELKRLKE
jgi:macrolide transport system ATP-binding/permease protein